jgi:O-antigen/teichoic acid export membrane protein
MRSDTVAEVSTPPTDLRRGRLHRNRLRGLAERSAHLNGTLLDQALVSGSNFLLAVLLTRFLGLADYGVFVLGWMAVLFFSSIQQALIVAPLVTLVPKRPAAERAHYAGAYFVQQIIFAAAAAAITVLGVFGFGRIQMDGRIDALVLPLAAVVFCFLWQDYMRRFLFAQRTTGPVLVADLLAYGGQIAAVLIVHQAGLLSIPAVLWCTAALFGASAAFQTRWMVMEAWNWRSVRATWREGWRFSSWLTASAFTQWFAGNLFIVAAGGVLGAGAAGAVRASQNVVGITHVLFLALENYLPARAAAVMADRGRAALLRYLGRASAYVGAATACGLLVVAVAPEFWLRTLYGPELVEYAFILTWFALLYLLVFVSTMLRMVLRTLEMTRSFFVSSVLTAGFSLMVAFPMVEWWGVTGVMVGLTVTQLIGIGCFVWSLYRGPK